MTSPPSQADGRQPAPAPGQPKVDSLAEAIQFFTAMLLATLRNVLIYSPKHAHFQRALEKAEQMAGIAFGFTPKIVFICLEKELFFEGKPMNKRGAQFQRLADFMHSLGVNRLQVLPGLAANELRVFALNLVGLNETGESTERKFIRATPHIRIGRLKHPEAMDRMLGPGAQAGGIAGPQGVPGEPTGRAATPGAGVAEPPGGRSAKGEGPGAPGDAGSASTASSRTDSGDAEAMLQGDSKEMAACETTLRLIASLAKDAGFLAVLAPLGEHHAPTYLHSINVALLAAAHAKALQAPPDLLRDILLAALFHDLGKLAVPATLLNKSGPRTEAEERVYQGHCLAGAQLLARHPAVPPSAVMAAFEHHLLASGDGGFPQTHRSAGPHWISQVIALSNFYDHVRSGAPGRPPQSPEAILEEMRRESPRRFRPDLTASFPEALETFESLSER
ncbi:MAG TPA: HD domain-containing phosphohydrolase [Candidatus Acidoferrum sp.]|nr:HD domain-containing phosphohydrolase [Candidatus Acidoferrum sp.]